MALFMDYHEDLKLPAEAVVQIADDTALGVSCGEVRQVGSLSWPGRTG